MSENFKNQGKNTERKEDNFDRIFLFQSQQISGGPEKNQIQNLQEKQNSKMKSQQDQNMEKSNQNNEQQNEQIVPDLRHTTSFEDICMENHGRSLVDSFMKVYGKNSDKKDLRGQRTMAKTLEQSTLQEKLNGDVFQNSQKSILRSYLKKNLEAKTILEYLNKHIPLSLIKLSFKLFVVIIQEYQRHKVHLMKEVEMENFIEQNLQNIHLKFLQVKEKSSLIQEQILLNSQNPELTKKWMETIFMGMNGIFQKNISRRISYEELVTDEEEFYRPQKYVKKH